MKKLLTLLLALLLIAGLAACGNEETPEEPTPEPAPEETPLVTEEAADESALEITVIIKAAESDYWQAFVRGAEAAAVQSDRMINVTTDGPAHEDSSQQVAILQSAAAAGPDAIVLAAIDPEAVAAAVGESVGPGILLITVDTRLLTEAFTSHLAVDHAAAAAQVAEEMYAAWEAGNIDPAGQSIAVVSATADSAVYAARTEGFIERITELVPDINVLEIQYADNDPARAFNITDSLIVANLDLIGIFGDNHNMGAGISQAIAEIGRTGIITFAFDAGEEQIEAIQAGNLTGLAVSNPWTLGFDAVMTAVEAILGNPVQREIEAPTVVVTRSNLNDPSVQEFLFPG